MTDKLFMISKFGSLSALSYVCDDDGRMLNSEVVDKLNEQQDIINKQLDQIIELQDKYRILEFNHSRLEKRNKAQYEKINKLKSELNDCEKFRYQVFKRIGELNDE